MISLFLSMLSSLTKKFHAISMASFLKYSPKEKFPNISKNVWCLGVFPTFSRSLCLPPARKHFCIEIIFLLSGLSCPVK